MASYLEQVKAEVQGFLDAKDEHGKLSIPICDPTAFNYRPVGREKVVGCLDGAKRLEMRNTGRYYRGGGFWDAFGRAFLGRRYAPILMGSPQRIAEREQCVTATGQLIVTDKAVSFEGDTTNERLSWAKIADVELLEDGVKITRRSGPPRIYAFTRFDPKFAAALFVMSKRQA